jgi:hypothetical protein
MGRQTLSHNSGLGEGSVRTILKRLKRGGFIEIDKLGCRLTDSGRRTYQSLSKRLSAVVALRGSSLAVGKFQVAVLVRSSSETVTMGIEQRDAAIRIGGTGATTYVVRSKKFTIPGGSGDCEKDFPSDVWPALRTELRPKDGDVVIVCGAGEEKTAKLGALSAALTLL